MLKLVNVRNWLIRQLAGKRRTVIINLTALGPIAFIGELENGSYFHNVTITIESDEEDIQVHNRTMSSEEFRRIVNNGSEGKP